MEGRREGGKVRKREEESRLIRYQGTIAGCTHQLPSQMRHKLDGVVDVASHLLKGWRQWSSNVMTTNTGEGGGGTNYKTKTTTVTSHSCYSNSRYRSHDTNLLRSLLVDKWTISTTSLFLTGLSSSGTLELLGLRHADTHTHICTYTQ